MPIIKGPNATVATDDFTFWGLAHFKAGQRNVTELHFHDCDEHIFLVSGKILMRSEGTEYTVETGDLQVTRMGDEHELLEVLEDTTYFWCQGPLRGQKRPGHLHRNKSELSELELNESERSEQQRD